METFHWIKRIVENIDTTAGRRFDLFIQLFIFLSLVTFSLETLPNLSDGFRSYLGVFELICIIIFTIEYLLRLIVADHWYKFSFSFFGLIDLLAILPFYITTGLDLRSIRAIRLLRLFRVLKLVRYNRAIQRFHIAFKLVKEEMILFFSAMMILLFFSAVGIYYFENPTQPEAFGSVFDSLWWATTTITTVGYGDIYPITAGGRCFTFFVLIIGLGIVAVPTGLLASALTKARELAPAE